MARQSAHKTVMKRAAEAAARSLIRDFNETEQLQVSQKGPADFVSAADKRAEKIIREELTKTRPQFGLLLEESGEIKGKQDSTRFIVDPLDGTTSFLHGIPHWSISIALEEDGEIVAALVHDPVKDEMFTAEKGGGAFMQRRRLRVSARRDLGSAVIAGGDSIQMREKRERYLGQLNTVLNNVAGFRRMGCAALDMCYVAAGRFEAFWEYGLKPWDVAAGHLIVREAGGFVRDVEDSSANPVYGESVFASNAALHDPLYQLLTAEHDNDARRA